MNNRTQEHGWDKHYTAVQISNNLLKRDTANKNTKQVLIETTKLQTADLVVMVNGLNYNIVNLKGGTGVTLISHQSTVKQNK